MRMIPLDLHTHTQWYCTHIHSGYCTHIHSGIAHTYTVVLRTHKQWYCAHINSGITHIYTVVSVLHTHTQWAHPKGIIGDVDPEMIGVEKVFI